ncbi:hypothetical protein JT05_07605 [Desulfosporosinus sp. Tol-M]|nr:hypothetical protein JT05_07605 [Desulfosporosinus sp. Tol-M]
MNGELRSRRRLSTSEDVNPLDGAINIVDAMLVFACGLLIALVIHWKVNPANGLERVNLQLGQEMSQETQIRSDLKETEGQGQLYEKLGTVYKDPTSGKMFMLTNK